MKANKLIFSPWFEQQGLIINYLDIGARGDISEPWSLFAPASINVIGFEPDPTEHAHLLKAYPQRSYYPSAVWGETAVRPFISVNGNLLLRCTHLLKKVIARISQTGRGVSQ